MKSTIHEHQKNNLKIVSKNLKNIGLALVLASTLFSCTPNDPNGNPSTTRQELLQIRSNSTGNASNLWDLQHGNLVSNISSLTTFTNARTGDPITSPAGLLSQTTMTYQSSSYDNINKNYSVALGETVVTYDLSGSTVSAPTVSIVALSGTSATDYIKAMEYVNTKLFVIQNDEIKILTSGATASIGSGVFLPTSGVSTDTFSNMTSNGTKIYFILMGKLYTFDTSGYTLSSVSITGWSPNIDYNGLEYCVASNRFYATKRYSSSPSTSDDFVSISLLGVENTMFTGLAYSKDFSRISSALDQNTNIYYLSSSDGFGLNSNTITEINLMSGTQAPYLSNAGYAFGLEVKD